MEGERAEGSITERRSESRTGQPKLPNAAGESEYENDARIDARIYVWIDV
jgi:hypothetical protein